MNAKAEPLCRGTRFSGTYAPRKLRSHRGGQGSNPLSSTQNRRSALDFDTTGFDISATAIGLAAQRIPGTTVHYEAPDLLQLPRRWLSAFGLVVEIITVQALPYRLHAQAIANTSSLIAPAGTLLVIAAVHDPHEPASPTGPCPLRREEIDAFADADLDIACIELVLAARVIGDHGAGLGGDNRVCRLGEGLFCR